ncbi:hypothetical protein N6B72_04960 [Chryseobacterium soli]|uniref:hypothetical protein n=1 Tax=Chryseobacterium soli TaxID=445961 RepID=UPI0029534CCB|nr:hypothetical protein [Chryseobacterium soli]MDV7696267.1 hypothetical protein [Chryseobacterium soli]
MKNENKSPIVTHVLITIVIAVLVALTSYISFYAGEKYGIAITERKYNPQK